MVDTPNVRRAKFAVGDLVHHQLFDYRGVVFDVDSTFQLTDEWYEQMARSRPPKNAPWYHVLVHGATHSTYVAEQNLTAEKAIEPIQHPLIGHFFASFENGRYVSQTRAN